ncbi:hypothetical protein [Cysteiniphilum sp. JM-1]|uniref:hypothetical protein n=1 Tax=Cysteiniphilum sp. JM-1 TaxID=2610891 RepID=UPI0012470656|nr:hypothetical protein [Cysteiniphilum sp. JM-1]
MYKNPDLDFVLNLKQAVKDGLYEYIEYQQIIVHKQTKVHIKLGEPILGTKLAEIKGNPFQHRGVAGLKQAEYALNSFHNMGLGNDPKLLVQSVIELLKQVRSASSHYHQRYSRFGCLTYHIMLAIYSSGYFIDGDDEARSKLLPNEDFERLKSLINGAHDGLDRGDFAYVFGGMRSLFEFNRNDFFKYLDFAQYGELILQFLRSLTNGWSDNAKDWQLENNAYHYSLDNIDEKQRLKSYMESSIKALQIQNPLAFSVVYLLKMVSDMNKRVVSLEKQLGVVAVDTEEKQALKASMQMIRKITGIEKDHISAGDWDKVLSDVHWLKPTQINNSPDYAGQFNDGNDPTIMLDNHMRPPLDSKNYAVKELANDLIDSLIDIHDGLAGALLSGCAQYLKAMGYEVPWAIDVAKGYSNGVADLKVTGLAGSLSGKAAGLISKYSFQTVDIGVNLAQRSNGVFGVHGVFGLERAYAIKNFAMQAIALRSRSLYANNPQRLEALCHARLSNMIRSFYQICYSLLDKECTLQKWSVWAKNNKRKGSETVHRSSLICFIVQAYLKFFDKEQNTLRNAILHKANHNDSYRIPYIERQKVGTYMKGFLLLAKGSNIYEGSGQGAQRTALCWQILNHSTRLHAEVAFDAEDHANILIS